MKKLITLLSVLFSLIAISEVSAQSSGSSNTSVTNYSQGIGLRLGGGSGITYKKFLSEKNAIEVIGAFHGLFDNGGNNYVGVTGLYQWVFAFPVKQMNWYVGAGADAGIWDGGNGGEFGLGIDGIVGLEYTLADAPVNFGLDLIPSLGLVNRSGFYWGNAALSVRYTF